MRAWRTAAKEIETMPQWSVWQLHQQLERDSDLMVLDVRQKPEWNSGHIKEAKHITGAELPKRWQEVPQQKPVAVVCGSGYRSSVSASLLKSRGYRQIVNVLGGMSAWKNAGFETVNGAS
ncbi:rhodanese-like domain-containing protein [Pleurocapsales cyanobacterium LEGE 06147]|nr:rhodanese-like domain-containing protein [Pleurocapsales cyanobacterium LEGE 06147]